MMTSSEEEGGDNGGVIGYTGGNNPLAFAASSTNNALPPKPNQQKLRALKEPACFGSVKAIIYSKSKDKRTQRRLLSFIMATGREKQ